MRKKIKALNTVIIADIDGNQLSTKTLKFIRETLSPAYKDQVLKEDLYNPSDFEDVHVLKACEKQVNEIIEACNEVEAAYFRIAFF